MRKRQVQADTGFGLAAQVPWLAVTFHVQPICVSGLSLGSKDKPQVSCSRLRKKHVLQPSSPGALLAWFCFHKFAAFIRPSLRYCRQGGSCMQVASSTGSTPLKKAWWRKSQGLQSCLTPRYA